MEYRNELKFQLDFMDIQKLKYRLEAFLDYDENQKGDFYTVRSLYFDDIYDTCLFESESGVDNRKKYRLRIYNGDLDVVHLEKKCKLRGMTKKITEEIPLEECRKLAAGKPMERGGGLAQELGYLMQSRNMTPKCIVEYDRCAMVNHVGNVRITFDMEVRGTVHTDCFLAGGKERFDFVMAPGMHILEIKYDELLPEPILRAVNLEHLQRQSISKYVWVRQKFKGQRSRA